MGSGVSILKISSHDKIDRVSGSGLGGGAFFGLCKLLTNSDNFDEMIELAKNGDSRNVNLLIGDIYGGDYGAVGLNTDLVAALFAFFLLFMLTLI